MENNCLLLLLHLLTVVLHGQRFTIKNNTLIPGWNAGHCHHFRVEKPETYTAKGSPTSPSLGFDSNFNLGWQLLNDVIISWVIWSWSLLQLRGELSMILGWAVPLNSTLYEDKDNHKPQLKNLSTAYSSWENRCHQTPLQCTDPTLDVHNCTFCNFTVDKCVFYIVSVQLIKKCHVHPLELL